eukprot:3138757-Lingulodinium_polyedra.AAC.1
MAAQQLANVATRAPSRARARAPRPNDATAAGQTPKPDFCIAADVTHCANSDNMTAWRNNGSQRF